MLVKCKKYSTMYPEGSQNIGDIFELTKEQALYYENIGWVEPLPDELQPRKEKKRGRPKKVGRDFAVDLSKSLTKGRFLEKRFTDK
jgi:hypothetical protein